MTEVRVSRKSVKNCAALKPLRIDSFLPKANKSGRDSVKALTMGEGSSLLPGGAGKQVFYPMPSDADASCHQSPCRLPFLALAFWRLCFLTPLCSARSLVRCGRGADLGVRGCGGWVCCGAGPPISFQSTCWYRAAARCCGAVRARSQLPPGLCFHRVDDSISHLIPIAAAERIAVVAIFVAANAAAAAAAARALQHDSLDNDSLQVIRTAFLTKNTHQISV